MNFSCKAALIIPTFNAGRYLGELSEGIERQTFRVNKKLIIDSSSVDNTVAKAREHNFDVHIINKKDFNHGGTRNRALDYLEKDVEIVIYMTQDALLASETSLSNLINVFSDRKVTAAYGRQLPRNGAGPIEAHARLFNYTDRSITKSLEHAKSMGMKSVFMSNSFAAYRREALMDVGGFPQHTILCEDMYVAAKMLLNNWKIGYSADAKVFHSHDYRMFEEFKRYFDLGVFQAKEPWIREQFGGAESEGTKYIMSELIYLLKNNVFLIPESFVRNLLKWIGYRAGIRESMLPLKLKKKLSMHRDYWEIK